MRELFNECKAKDKSINYTTFRTRLYENAIPYKTVWSRNIWWKDLKGLDKNVPQEAIDELHTYLKTIRSTPQTTQPRSFMDTLISTCPI